MITVRCEQCGQEFQAQRRSAKFRFALCRQHHRRRHPPVVPPPTFWERFNRAFEETKVLVTSPDHIGDRNVSVHIIVTNDNNDPPRMWEFHVDV